MTSIPIQHILLEDGHSVEITTENDKGESVEYIDEYETVDQTDHNKIHYCPNCGNAHYAVGSLKMHMKACLREKPELEADKKCNICSKVLKSRSYLKEHILKIHKGEKLKPCTLCYRKFLTEEKLKAHMEQHQQQKVLSAQHGGKKMVSKEYVCSCCSEKFSVIFEADNVKRRFVCDPCREKFSNGEKTKQPNQEEPKRELSCDRCGRKFVFEGFLNRHLPQCDGTPSKRRRK